MRFIALPVAVLGFSVLGWADPVPEWHPPTVTDFRGPCPMMNTLANHGYLPHDGRNITKEAVVSAMGSALNFDPALANIMFEQAVIANPEPNATFFSLDDLNRHNVLEHDASLSRMDAYFGSNHVFDQATFNETRAYWGPIIDADMIANSKVARQLASKAFNPTYRFTEHIEDFSLGEMAAPFIAFGDIKKVTVDRELVVYLFENERLPTELGWTRKTQVIKVEDILAINGKIGAATSLFTVDNAPNTTAHDMNRRRDLHAGIPC
ncbi:unnamed protein product [Periconia digitata]|uniref:Heme haloperoxidase family profile domain-containing protein n=1 Tax=Periconia digitata TaxID=1303443 RepID=A0A9W4UBP9_9PLEO|nr:unnamed protein product [Periconia digitata]